MKDRGSGFHSVPTGSGRLYLHVASPISPLADWAGSPPILPFPRSFRAGPKDGRADEPPSSSERSNVRLPCWRTRPRKTAGHSPSRSPGDTLTLMGAIIIVLYPLVGDTLATERACRRTPLPPGAGAIFPSHTCPRTTIEPEKKPERPLSRPPASRLLATCE
jgi:hypothetical protein